MEISEEDPLYYDIELRISKNTEGLISEEGLLQADSLRHEITKHPKEIRNFLKLILKRVKEFSKQQKPIEYSSEQLNQDRDFIASLMQHHTTKFIFELNKNRATKAIANLADLKQGLYHSISILNIINTRELWMDDEVVNFFEISMFNFYKHSDVHNILKQGYIFKQAGGRPSKNRCWCVFLRPMSYSRKWFILTNQFLCYVERPFPSIFHSMKSANNQKQMVTSDVNKNNGDQNAQDITMINNDEDFQLKEVLLIDNLWRYNMRKGIQKTKITVYTNNRVLGLKFLSYNFKSWKHKIDYAMDHSPWSNKLERFVESSFAPLRKGNRVRLMIDGEMYFRNVAEEITKAQYEIFITDWWLCPKYYLVRPVSLASKQDSEQFRFDMLILQAAQRGVKVYIMHWRESRFGVTFNSLITKEYLMGLHPNIKMARHSSGAIQLWSHHAKLVVIDQQIVFVGGLDICYGRWDTRNHPLIDIGTKETDQCFYPGQDYCNEKKTPMEKTEDHTFNTLDREREVRMPFHDTAVCIEGDTAMDLSHHFVHLWNHAKLDKHGKTGKFASITTHTKYRGLFRSVFKKMKTGQQAGVVSIGYQSPAERKRQKEILKQLQKNKPKSQEYKNFNFGTTEDDKFDEGLEGIISKNVNFQEFKNKQNEVQSPHHLSALNNMQFGRKIQNIIGILKQRNSSQNVAKNSLQTPSVSKRISSEYQDEGIIEKHVPKKSPFLELPDQNNEFLSRPRPMFEKAPELNPSSPLQCTLQKESNRNPEENEQNIEQILNDSGVVLQKSHTIPQPALQIPLNQNQESQISLADSLRNEEQKLMQKEGVIEDKIEKKQIKQQKSLRKFRTHDDFPYVRTEEVQILMHTPHKNKRDTQESKQPKLQDREEGKDDLLSSRKYNSVHRELISKFNAHGDIVEDQVDAKVYNNCLVQAARSGSPWSLGLLKVEHSIYEAYIQLIELSQKFIYIENQFFITQSILFERNKRNIVKNKIGLALRERILRAHRHKEDFFVMVFVPLLPAFSGDILDSSSSILRIQVNYQYKSITKGKRSLIELLKSDGIEDPWKYIKFFSLRGHSVMPATQLPQTEMIYIHSKTMVVDDTHMIIGSANINDRSMLGSRDHEIGVVITQNQPEDLMEVEIDGKPMKVSKLVHNFRTQLMMEHFGLPYNEIKDPISSKEKIKARAEDNSKLYFEIFKCEPDDCINNFDKLEQIRDKRKIEQEDIAGFTAKYNQLKEHIQGHVVNYPVYFMIDEKLGQNFFNSEIVVPEITFV